jgi:hypothetical protein
MDGSTIGQAALISGHSPALNSVDSLKTSWSRSRLRKSSVAPTNLHAG